VQALRNEIIPASLQCEQLSDFIDWNRSPFYVNLQNKAWPRRSGKRRLGAVSAFGMSGTNAHVVVEEYDDARDATSSFADRAAAPGFLLVLSAKTGVALRRRALDLIDLLKDGRHAWDGVALAALGHALMNNRQHFHERCALVVTDREQAIALLEKVGGNEKLPMLSQGKVSRDLSEQPLLREFAADLLDKIATLQDDSMRYRQSLMALGDLYCQGYQLNWPSLYGEHARRRIGLPTYPFSRERYWVETVGKADVRHAVKNSSGAPFDSRQLLKRILADVVANKLDSGMAVSATKKVLGIEKQ